MAIVYSYPLNKHIKITDELVGTTNKSINGRLKTVTRNFLLEDLAIFFITGGGIQKQIELTTVGISGAATLNQTTGVLNIPIYETALQDLQSVANIGYTTTTPIVANSFVKIGGTGNNLLLDNGTTIAISSVGGSTNLSYIQATDKGTVTSDTGTDAIIPLSTIEYAGLLSPVEKVKLNDTSGINTGDQNLQSVTNLGASTTNAITANSFVKSGGTSSQILAADGSVITQGNNITIIGGVISSVGGSGGGGSSVNYYLNGGTSQGTFGGTTYYEFSKTAVIGTGADFSRGSNGLIVSFITDVADPSLLLIPGGNWNLEFFFSASSSGGSPSFYVELYKYGGTTFTLIASSSATPEGITNGTSIDAYFTALAVPETVLTVNDRLAIRIFVNASSKTITLHTQNGHLCEVITTFTAGLTALNGLQTQVQNFATGTAGTDFDIVSSGSTHTFNLPSASTTARGLVTTGTQTFAGDKTFIDAVDILLSGSALKATSVQGVALEAIGGNNGNPIGKFTRLADLSEIARFDNTGLKLQLEIASTIASFDINKNVVSLPLATYPSLTELTYLKGVTSALQPQINLKATKLMAANTIRVNNTAVAANAQEIKYFASGIIPMTETISFTAGVAPSNPQLATYNWTQVGNMVDVVVNLNYLTSGTTVTLVSFPFPTSLPEPLFPTGYLSASSIGYTGVARAAASFIITTANASNLASFIRVNSSLSGYEFVISAASGTYQKFSLSIKYFTA